MFNFELQNFMVIMFDQLNCFKLISYCCPNYLMYYYFEYLQQSWKNFNYCFMFHLHSNFNFKYFDLCFIYCLKYSIDFDFNSKWIYYYLVYLYLNCQGQSLENYFEYFIVNCYFN